MSGVRVLQRIGTTRTFRPPVLRTPRFASPLRGKRGEVTASIGTVPHSTSSTWYCVAAAILSFGTVTWNVLAVSLSELAPLTVFFA